MWVVCVGSEVAMACATLAIGVLQDSVLLHQTDPLSLSLLPHDDDDDMMMMSSRAGAAAAQQPNQSLSASPRSPYSTPPGLGIQQPQPPAPTAVPDPTDCPHTTPGGFI
jgi:hypothetical protein